MFNVIKLRLYLFTFSCYFNKRGKYVEKNTQHRFTERKEIKSWGVRYKFKANVCFFST